MMLALLTALSATVVIAPLAADAVAIAGFRVPFPRIFDRVVMVAAAVALLLFARRLRLAKLLDNGFRNPSEGLPQFGLGIATAIIVIASLLAIAAFATFHPISWSRLPFTALRYLPAALLIGVIEETFFRAILLGGLMRDINRNAALIISSVIYALTHLIRSPAHYYLTGLHPTAGIDNLLASAARLVHPGDLSAMVAGLFLLGLLLGRVFIVTGRIYSSIGLHAGLVVGAKCWPVLVGHSRRVPLWLAGPGPVPLVAGPAAWALTVLLLVCFPLLLRQCLPARAGHSA
jgi:membrane protease YdiL (CAAX protease family)